jgi:hypothetical protein
MGNPPEDCPMPEQAESTLDLEQPENQRASSREWWAERIGWAVISIILIAALLGAFGPGPLSHREATSEDGRLTVDYYRVQRYAAPAELRIRFEPDANAELVQLAFSQTIVDEIKLESITPPPTAAILQDDRVVYSFRVADLRERGHVVYRFEHESFGPLTGTVALLPDSEIELSQFIYP